MASTKRERSALSTSDDVSARFTKKPKYMSSLQHFTATHDPHTVNVSANTNRPGGAKRGNSKEKAKKPHPLIDKQRPAHRAMTSAEKRAKQQHLDDQVGFIILTRDNNKPDAYGTVSTTYAPQSWSTVAKAYNQKYGVSVTSAAMEKRARQHRAAWIAKHPSYPTEITYAKRGEGPPTLGSGISAGKAEYRDTLRVSENDTCNERIAGWTPPDEVRNSSDLRAYIEHAESTGTGAATIEIFDAHEALLGTATIDRQVLQQNCGVSSQLYDDEYKVRVQLYGPLEKIVQCYALCTSSSALSQLLDHETFNGVSLMQLYCLAAQLDDDHVRGLVLDQWCLLSEQNKDVELVLDDLNFLFECTRCNDPARDLLARSVCVAGLTEDLLAMDACVPVLSDCLRRLAAEESVGYMR